MKAVQWWVPWVGLLATLALACASPPRWRADDKPTARDAAQLFSYEGATGLFRELHVGEIPLIPLRQNLRPCCAFGEGLQTSVGPVPIPGVVIGNLVAREDLGHHIYDNGVVQVGSRLDEEGFFHSERNGLVYTCHGGFVDTAHVRDYADWTIFLATTIARNLEAGIELALPDEGGRRVVIVEPMDAESIERRGRRATSIGLAQWLAFQMSVWHEIATWFGWSSLDAFPEKVSAFSPEDLYSNMLGARIAAAASSQGTSRDELLYNRSFDEWLDRALDYLGSVDVETAREAMTAVDGLWWDSRRRLPDPALVLRRNLLVGPALIPWVVPAERVGPRLEADCGRMPALYTIGHPSEIDGLSFSSLGRLVIEVSEELAAQEPFRSLDGKVSDTDFPAILDVIREQNRAEFGPTADRPE